jgi:AcrR family transcriptional regulator
MSGPQRREQLLDVTKALVDRGGFHAVSIDAVAKAAGITRPIVYDHFTNLDALLRATFERETQRALGQLATLLPAAASSKDPKELLLQSLEAYLDAVATDPATWRLVLMPAEGTPAVLHELVEAGREAIIAALAQVAVTKRPSPDPELTARLLSALSDDMARLHLGDAQRYPVSRLIDQARWFIGLL